MDPVTLGKTRDLYFLQVAPVLIVDIGHASRELEACLADQAFLLALFAGQGFLFDQQRQSFGKSQTFVGANLLQLALQGMGHAAEFELP